MWSQIAISLAALLLVMYAASDLASLGISTAVATGLWPV
jgi:hypothetical protein